MDTATTVGTKAHVNITNFGSFKPSALSKVVGSSKTHIIGNIISNINTATHSPYVSVTNELWYSCIIINAKNKPYTSKKIWGDIIGLVSRVVYKVTGGILNGHLVPN